MKKILLALFVILTLFVVSCDNNPSNVPPAEEPTVPPEASTFSLKGRILDLDFAGYTRACSAPEDVESITISINEDGDSVDWSVFTAGTTCSGTLTVAITEGETFTITNSSETDPTALEFTVVDDAITSVSGSFVGIVIPASCTVGIVVETPKTSVDAFKGHMYFANSRTGIASRITFTEDNVIFNGYTNVAPEDSPYAEYMDDKYSWSTTYDKVSLEDGVLKCKAIPSNGVGVEEEFSITVIDNVTLSQSFYPGEELPSTLKLVK